MAPRIPAKDVAVPEIEALAARIMALDLVITVDTMVAHLAGALGAPVDPLPVGVWPLQPQPQVVRAFDPPDSPFGAGHRGVDLAGSVGQPVVAALAGRITFAVPLAGRGVVVVDHGPTRTTYEPVAAVAVLLLVLAAQAAQAARATWAARVLAWLGIRTGLAVPVPAAILAGLPVLAAVPVLTAVAVLVPRAELTRVVAGLRGSAGIRRNGFGAGPRGPVPGRILGAARVQRPRLAVPGLVVHRLVSGRRRREVLIRAPAVPAGQPW